MKAGTFIETGLAFSGSSGVAFLACMKCYSDRRKRKTIGSTVRCDEEKKLLDYPKRPHGRLANERREEAYHTIKVVENVKGALKKTSLARLRWPIVLAPVWIYMSIG